MWGAELLDNIFLYLFNIYSFQYFNISIVYRPKIYAKSFEQFNYFFKCFPKY